MRARSRLISVLVAFSLLWPFLAEAGGVRCRFRDGCRVVGGVVANKKDSIVVALTGLEHPIFEVMLTRGSGGLSVVGASGRTPLGTFNLSYSFPIPLVAAEDFQGPFRCQGVYVENGKKIPFEREGRFSVHPVSRGAVVLVALATKEGADASAVAVDSKVEVVAYFAVKHIGSKPVLIGVWQIDRSKENALVEDLESLWDHVKENGVDESVLSGIASLAEESLGLARKKVN